MKMAHFVTVSSAAYLLSCPTGAVATAKAPSVVELLTRVVKASRNVGPMSSTFRIVTTEDGRAIPANVSGEEKRNDPTHSVTTACMRIDKMVLSRMRVYVNGQTEITCDEMKGEYHRVKATDRTKTESIVSSLASMLAMPKAKARIAKVAVRPLMFEARPAWRLSWLETDVPKGVKGPVRVSLIVDQADSLIRKYSYAPRRGTGLTMTSMYRRQKMPYPPEAFVFTPSGAKEARK